MKKRSFFLAMSLCQLFILYMFTNSYAQECTKDEILKLINAGYSKTEIEKICNKSNKIRKNNSPNKNLKKQSHQSEIAKKNIKKRNYNTKNLDPKRLAQLLCNVLNQNNIPSALKKYGKVEDNDGYWDLETDLLYISYDPDDDETEFIISLDPAWEKNIDICSFGSKSEFKKWLSRLGQKIIDYEHDLWSVAIFDNKYGEDINDPFDYKWYIYGDSGCRDGKSIGNINIKWEHGYSNLNKSFCNIK
ncbi:MAG: hypothetical protein GY749_18860 [Desulfobacteraceae bacterium]|nr:hypothetical protein [Desulfobacteraceae bacterium]